MTPSASHTNSAKPALKLVHDSHPQWTAPTADEGRPITGHFHDLDIRGYLEYALPGGNPRPGQLSSLSTINPASFGKIPVELNNQGLYIGMRKWTKRAPTTFEEARVWQKRNENALVRLGRISTFPKGAAALIAIDCDAESPEMSAAFLEIVEKKFGRLSLRRRSDKPHRWLALLRAAGEAGDLAPVRVIYHTDDGHKARIEILSRGCQVAVAGVSASGGMWEWRDGMPALSELKRATGPDLVRLERAFRAVVRAQGGQLGREGSSHATKPRERRQSRPREELSAEQWINQQALDNIPKWAPALFHGGDAAGDGAWRVPPGATCRACEEDLAIHQNGIFDFGGERGYTAIGLIQAFFDEDADGNLIETERFDEEGTGFSPLGSVSRERAIAELCHLLEIDWAAERERDGVLADAKAQADFDDIAAEEGAEGAREEKPAVEPPAPCTIDEVHAIFRRWLGDDYDLVTLDAALAAAAAERLPGDPAWLLIISGPGNAKTETVQALSALDGCQIVSTIASEGALLSATPKKERDRGATGGLLRRIGERGILVVKDVTSILSADRNTRGPVLAALREVYDGHWSRNVGTDGGRTLDWRGRLVVIGACTTAWDQAHGVVSVMGDRFVLIRSDSHIGRINSGMRAIRNTGEEKAMRAEMAAAVAGLISTVDPDKVYQLSQSDEATIVNAANLTTLARTGVETDYRGDVIDAHAPEMPTRLAKQLAQLMRGAVAIGIGPQEALQLALRCARDSLPQLRLAVLCDVARHPGSKVIAIRRRVQRPRLTVDRTLQALHALGLLHCREEEEVRASRTVQTRFYSLALEINPEVLGVDCSQGSQADFDNVPEAEFTGRPEAGFVNRPEGPDEGIVW
jgi:hypothetical protein